jgi:glycosyltransferase A (GT-A) superfamily protein (DUF2064 family)
MAMYRASAESLAIAIFARAPLAGAAKTRLIPALGAAGAARLQRRLTCMRWPSRGGQRSAASACGGRRMTSHASFAPSSAALASICARSRALTWVSAWPTPFAAQAGPLLLIGTDCPALQPAHLSAAASALLDD